MAEARQGVGCSVSLEKVNCLGPLVQQWIAFKRRSSLSFFTETLFLLCAGLYDMHVCMHVFAGVWLACTLCAYMRRLEVDFVCLAQSRPPYVLKQSVWLKPKAPLTQHVSRVSLSLGIHPFLLRSRMTCLDSVWLFTPTDTSPQPRLSGS